MGGYKNVPKTESFLIRFRQTFGLFMPEKRRGKGRETHEKKHEEKHEKASNERDSQQKRRRKSMSKSGKESRETRSF
ncbi:hypothetical protein MHB42_19335 [Lysinibacillus sp. FSL K6-0232]|uniref:hypothetical protein n=1 Tax=Lysinibacillus sp. FSL K6-0232 TaxID=2921425 RepID=UPI0030FCCAF0